MSQPRRRPRYLEDGESMALMAWARVTFYAGRPIADHLAHVPNGGRRNKREAARLKLMGVQPGYPDYVLDIMRFDESTKRWLGGMKIELKAAREAGRHLASTSSEQLAQLSRLTVQGYRAVRAYGWVEAASLICKYLGIRFNGPCTPSS